MGEGRSTYATFQAPPPSARKSSAPHPLQDASLFSRVAFGWVTPLLALGNEKQLDGDDMWPLEQRYHTGTVTAKFGHDFAQSGSLLRAFWQSFGWQFVLVGLMTFVSTATTFAGPVVLNHVVASLSTREYDPQDLATWIFGLLATQLLSAFVGSRLLYHAAIISMQFTAALKSLIYKKALKLNAESRKLKSTGDISNLCKTDCVMIEVATTDVHQLWVVPLQILVASVMLYRLLGLASLAGFAVIGLSFVLNHYLSVRFMDLYVETMECKDERLKVVTEAFKAISLVKFNTWEDKFLQRINLSRAAELKTMWRFMKFIAYSVMVAWGLPVFISVATFGVHTGVFHEELTPTAVFTGIALFQLIQQPLRYFSDIIASVVKASVAIQRMSEFLILPEIDANDVLTIKSPEADQFIAKNVIVAIENGSFGWEKGSTILNKINLRVKIGDFVVVHGPVGSGKSFALLRSPR